MAIDTKAKRYSMIAFGSGVALDILPDTDGSIDTADMQHLLWLYSGIAVSAPAVIISVISLSGIRNLTESLSGIRNLTESLSGKRNLTESLEGEVE